LQDYHDLLLKNIVWVPPSQIQTIRKQEVGQIYTFTTIAVVISILFAFSLGPY